jgi:3D (Asp-Asp-Asp) domain-containing protein
MGLLYQANSVMAASLLSYGSIGPEVAKVQKALNSKGYPCGPADAIYGPRTNQAVLDFQQDAGLVPDGLVGPKTYEALGLLTSESRANLENNNDQSADKSYEGRKLTMVATGYDDSWESNYPYYGQPSYIGMPLQRGVVAVDPNVIPMGTRLYVEGYGEAIAADQGGAIKGNRIDLFFDSRQEALDWGIRSVEVTILS